MYEYDGLDRLVKAVLAPAAEGRPAALTRFDYNQQDQLVKVTDPRELTTRYAVNGLGQRTGVASPDSGDATARFDLAGNLIKGRDARGKDTSYNYDAARRLTRITFADGQSNTYTYGSAGSGATGKLSAMSDESGRTSFSYDGFGRLIEKLQSVGRGGSPLSLALRYSYGSSGSSTGHVTTMTYPSGNRIDMTYDANGQVSGLALRPASVADTVNGFGMRIGIASPDIDDASARFDLAGM